MICEFNKTRNPYKNGTEYENYLLEKIKDCGLTVFPRDTSKDMKLKLRRDWRAYPAPVCAAQMPIGHTHTGPPYIADFAFFDPIRCKITLYECKYQGTNGTIYEKFGYLQLLAEHLKQQGFDLHIILEGGKARPDHVQWLYGVRPEGHVHNTASFIKHVRHNYRDRLN